MSDPERPRLKPLDSPIDPADPGPLTGSFQVPAAAALAFEDPLSHDIHIFLNLAAKASKGLRVYASNNETLKRYVDDAFRVLSTILDRTEEMTLTVREDRFLFNKDVVHINNEREESIPYIFYRNAFRRVTLVRGMTREELVQLLSAVVADYGGFDYAGEDLVTALWRIALPHLRYLTIDAMTIDAKSAKSQTERDDIERIQADIEGIVAQIYKTSATDEDIVAGVSITKEDLEALKEIRLESEEDLDALDVATARAIANINPADLESLNTTLLVESRDTLTTKLLDILIIVAFKEQSSAESVMTMELIQQLFDALLVSQRYVHATHLVRKLREHTATTDNLKEKHIATHLLRMFATEARVVPLLNNFNDDHKTRSVSEITEFLRALGAPIVPHLLSALDFLASPAHRRLVCDLILEHGIPDRRLLMQRMQGAKWFLARDILHIGSKLPPNELAPLIDAGLRSEHPKVREYAVGLLRPYARGSADRLIAERLLDEDLEVRLSAIRVAAARRTPDTRAAFEVLLDREDLADREPRELRLLMAAYASICGAEAVPLLDKILAPSLFGKARMADAQIAAAFALASIGSLAATSALQRGTRTLNTRVREACKKALAGAFERSPSSELQVPTTADLPVVGGSGGIPSGKTDPLAPLPSAIPQPSAPSSSSSSSSAPPAAPVRPTFPPPAEGTPVNNRSAKAIGVSADAVDFSAAAPAPVEEKKKEQHPQFVSGPALGRVHAVHQSREEIPIAILMGSPVESTSPAVHDPSEERTTAAIVSAPPPSPVRESVPPHARETVPPMRESVPIVPGFADALELDSEAATIARAPMATPHAPVHMPPELSLAPIDENAELDLELDDVQVPTVLAPQQPASRGEELELDIDDQPPALEDRSAVSADLELDETAFPANAPSGARADSRDLVLDDEPEPEEELELDAPAIPDSGSRSGEAVPPFATSRSWPVVAGKPLSAPPRSSSVGDELDAADLLDEADPLELDSGMILGPAQPSPFAPAQPPPFAHSPPPFAHAPPPLPRNPTTQPPPAAQAPEPFRELLAHAEPATFSTPLPPPREPTQPPPLRPTQPPPRMPLSSPPPRTPLPSPPQRTPLPSPPMRTPLASAPPPQRTPLAPTPPMRTPVAPTMTPARGVAMPLPPLDLDLDGFAHPLGSRPISTTPLPSAPAPHRPLPSFPGAPRDPSPPIVSKTPIVRGTREVMPALPQMELPSQTREVARNQDRVNVPSKRAPIAAPAPAPIKPTPAPIKPTPAPLKPMTAPTPPASTPPGFADDLFLEAAPRPPKNAVPDLDLDDHPSFDDDEPGHV